ncbi:MAG TPA: fibronectin type III domain-containing protein, partial [Flavisolibacter sp.]|nr:fibronectin type III domain-containing protein [Flavisolibacter sp.]
FDRMADAKLVERASAIHQEMVTNATAFPSPSPSLTQVRSAIDDFQEALNAAVGGDRVLVAQKNIARQTLVNLLHLLGYYVLFTAQGNRLIALKSGFRLAKDPTPVVITKPTGLKVENGDQDGVLQVSIKTVPGAVAYMHQYSTDPALKEDSWMSVTCSTAKCHLAGLQPGTKYFIRVGAIGTKEQVLFSDTVSKIAA